MPGRKFSPSSFLAGGATGCLVSLIAVVLITTVAIPIYKGGVSVGRGVHGRDVRIIAATEDIASGSVVQIDQITERLYPAQYLPPRYLPISLTDDIVGQTIRHPVRAGQPLLATDLVILDGRSPPLPPMPAAPPQR